MLSSTSSNPNEEFGHVIVAYAEKPWPARVRRAARAHRPRLTRPGADAGTDTAAGPAARSAGARRHRQADARPVAGDREPTAIRDAGAQRERRHHHPPAQSARREAAREAAGQPGRDADIASRLPKGGRAWTRPFYIPLTPPSAARAARRAGCRRGGSTRPRRAYRCGT